MADNNSSDLDIGGEMEREFPPLTLNQQLQQQKGQWPMADVPQPPPSLVRSTKSVASVTEQIKTLAQTLIDLRREMDELEKLVATRLQAMRDRLGKL